jgi:hypothetical protein
MIPNWQKCDDHGGFGFKSDCIICKGKVMTDDELIEKMALDMYPAITMSVGKTIAEKHINMVWEHYAKNDLTPIVVEAGDIIRQKERAKIKAECIEAIRKMHDECGGLSLHYAIKALKEV